MAKAGFLDSNKMAHTFDALRANDLIFSYVVNNWLLGNKPPGFDLLVWNKDSTRMPARMHSQYLRSCYLRNDFALKNFEVNGVKLDPAKVDIDTYVLAAVDDHIVPWASAYRTTQLFGGVSRFVLSDLRAQSPGSSTRPGRRPSTGPTMRTPPMPSSGKRKPRSRATPGGKTGRSGSRNRVVRWSQLRASRVTGITR